MKIYTAEQNRLREHYGPWAVVTGASDGIGREFAYRLAEAGLNLVLVARRSERLENMAHELYTKHGTETQILVLDLSTHAGVDELITKTRLLPVGLLVAAAGFGTSGPFIENKLADELAMVDVNCRAVTALAHTFGQRFVDRRRGGMILMSSLVAFQGVPRAANYAATKAYVQSLAEALRIELGKKGVDVVCCAPGPIRSGFGTRAKMSMGFAQTPKDVAAETLWALGRYHHVRPGWLAKLLQYSLALLPRWIRVRVVGLIMAGMT